MNFDCSPRALSGPLTGAKPASNPALLPHKKTTVNKENQNDKDNTVMDRDDQMILTLLKAIDESPDTTQKDLATRLGVAVGLVNSYLKRVIYKGYVKTKQLDRRRLKYLLTPTGIREKSRLTYEFLEYSYQYIMEVRSRVRDILAPLSHDGCRRVIFYGSGEVAELSYLAIRELGMELAGIVDPGSEGAKCLDHVIRDLEWLRGPAQADVLLELKSKGQSSSKTAELKEIAHQRGMLFFSLE
ncbi:MAG: winged helix-turn-helix transcriptional regulator [bacterium]|nr:winged helix-turn-helix transcriptional regulator [bacterium]